MPLATELFQIKTGIHQYICGAFYFTEHTCCNMLSDFRPKETIYLDSLNCFVLLVVEVPKKLNLSWT